MSKSSKRKRGKEQNSRGLSLIKDVKGTSSISEQNVEYWQKVDHPLFSFKYLNDVSIKKCKDYSFFYKFLLRLQKLSELGWEEIRKSHKHAYGMEKIPVNNIVPRRQLPDFVTSEVELDVFRAVGDNRTFVGLQQGKIFYIFFIETVFGDVCPH